MIYYYLLQSDLVERKREWVFKLLKSHLNRQLYKSIDWLFRVVCVVVPFLSVYEQLDNSDRLILISIIFCECFFYFLLFFFVIEKNWREINIPQLADWLIDSPKNQLIPKNLTNCINRSIHRKLYSSIQ